MVAHPSYFSSEHGLTDQMGADQFRPPSASLSTAAYAGTGAPPLPAPNMEYQPFTDFLPLLNDGSLEGATSTPVGVSLGGTAHPSCLLLGAGTMWFGLIHVEPKSIVLGNILGTVQVSIDLFNADVSAHNYTAFTNNAGAGVSINNPGLPTSLGAYNGITLTLTVTPDGPPSVDSTLDYSFDIEVPDLVISQPISLTRLVAFPYAPSKKIREELSWLTDIIRATDGTEQRIALRNNPRQLFDLGVFRKDGPDRQRLENLLFDWQARLFGLPIWHEQQVLTADASAGQLSLTVDSTAYADFRDGGLGMLWVDDTTFEVINIDTVAGTTINLSSQVVGNYPVGTRIFPMVTAFMEKAPRIERFANGGADYRVRFLSQDNEANVASTAAFDTYGGKVLFNDKNFVRNAVRETSEREIVVIDGSIGSISQKSLWDVSRRTSAKRFRPQSRQRLWEIRQVLHALRGRQVSFYLPTFAAEVTPILDIASGGSTLRITHCGYTDFVQSRAPKNLIRVVETDGTETIREVTGSSEISSTEEELTISGTWPAAVALADIERIDFIEKARLDTDTVVFIHDDHGGRASIVVPTRVVLD